MKNPNEIKLFAINSKTYMQKEKQLYFFFYKQLLFKTKLQCKNNFYLYIMWQLVLFNETNIFLNLCY